NAGRRGPLPMHRLEHPISGLFQISHGRGLSAIIPAYLIYTFNLHKDRLETLSEGLFGKKDAKLAVIKIVEWLKKVDALNGLKDLGINKESFNDFLESALRDDNNKDFIIARKKLYRNEMLEIYNLAFDYSNIDELINGLT
ncbi:MAG: iron-containing alcohol dehydrogenase, partial [Caldisericaceae bacterium]